MDNVQKLEEEIYHSFQTSKLRKCTNSILKQGENFDRERKCWDREKKRLEHEIQKIHTYALEVAKEAKRLQIGSCISLTQCKAKITMKLREIKSLQSGIKMLKAKLA